MSVGANFQVSEGTLDGDLTISFPLKFKRIIITNDSGSAEMTFKFNTTETAATLKPTEIVTLDIRARDIIMNGTNVSYRIWAIT